MKPIEQQLRRDADDKYPGPTDWKVSTEEESNKISRVEVICIGQGRDYVNMDTGKVELSYQDDGRTLKVFVEKMRNKPEWADKDMIEAYEAGYTAGIGKDWDEEHGYHTPTAEEWLKEK